MPKEFIEQVVKEVEKTLQNMKTNKENINQTTSNLYPFSLKDLSDKELNDLKNHLMTTHEHEGKLYFITMQANVPVYDHQLFDVNIYLAYDVRTPLLVSNNIN